ncbi:UPF0158 family protein [Methanospirillum lacunae]|uniref:Uncharacterized protein n=1 Tax=Methanospirillum lacunae TaxID=668570 RepID=A0A2V2N4C4_9EURY|nr:UPF0158 family protein [Methanospirillum lacunae]PWR72616.1 hypothetical protein DK846_06525 [Methanospirillum lacunae]
MMIDEKKRNGIPVHLSIDDVAEALDNCTYDTRYILDLEKQEIIELSENMISDDEIQDVFEEIDEDETGRYIPFPIRTDSRDGYADMQLFIETIEDQLIRNEAVQTITGSGAFRRFKDFIRFYPELEKRWFTWKDERASLRALEWLEEEGLILKKDD